MLKAMRMALYDEVIKTGNFVAADNFTALYEFVNLLSNVSDPCLLADED